MLYYYLIYASSDLQFRFELFESLINALSGIDVINMNSDIGKQIANNMLVSAFSAIYQYPDELG